ncbi:MAG TPA: glycosyltransferase family 2 protein [Solirubrobacteraceae bacterium]|jgi:hypothetical protein|nr:glycosyltransferase family 2 protein [Solirubrobacteraceae bacterium]
MAPIVPPSLPAPRVTVVIPCFNYGHYLPRCIDTILEQPDVTADVLIVDDASTDGSGDVAERLAGERPRVRVIRHARNAGHIATYNDGLAEVTGDYVVLLSADDLLTPGSLARSTSLLEAHPTVGMVYGHAVRFSGAEPPRARTESTSWTIWSGIDWLNTRFRLGRNCIFSPEVVLRTSVQREIGGYRSDLPHSGDLEMWLRAAAVADVGYVTGADQAWYRVHAENMHTTVFQSGELDGMVGDLRERLAAFELAAERMGGRMTDTGALVMDARRAIAIEGLNLAIRSYHWGMSDVWPVHDLAALATEIYPAATRLPQFQILCLRRRGGTLGRRQDPLSVGHEIVLKARELSRDWRWARAGL